MKPELNFFHDWDSFAFWRPMHYRDFTLIAAKFETVPHRYYEIHFALLGFHVWSQWLKSS